jgi:hypothetical protein
MNPLLVETATTRPLGAGNGGGFCHGPFKANAGLHAKAESTAKSNARMVELLRILESATRVYARTGVEIRIGRSQTRRKECEKNVAGVSREMVMQAPVVERRTH